MANFTQDRMYEMLGEISKKQKPSYKAGGLKEADCPFGYSLVNGKCVPDPDCEDGQCRETDEIQAIYDKADSIPNRVVDFEKGIVDEIWTDPATGQYRDYIVMGKPGQDAREVWKKHGVKNFVEPSCMYVAGLGYRCAPESEEYLKKFNPVHFNSNIGFIHAVDRGDVPFKRIDKFSDRNFDALEKGNVQVGDIVNFKGADNSHAMTFAGYSEDGHPKYFDSNGSSRHVGIHGAWPDLRPNDKGTGKDYAYVNRFDTERYVDDTYGKQVADLEKQARENPTYYKQGGLTKYAPGGVTADPPDWLTKRGANVYFNPMYQNNFTGSSSTLDKNALGTYRTSFSPVIGISGSLSKNRNAGDEKGRGWLYDAYAGLNPNAMKEGNFIPSAGVNFDWENSPQDKNFRPHVTLGADYNPDTGFNAAFSSGARIPFTPYGNKKIKPGYGLGHMDIYGGVRGGMDAEGEFSGGLTYGTRVHGKYMPKRNSLFGKVLGRNAYLYGEAGVNFDPQKGKFTEKEKPSTMVIATEDGLANRDITSTSDGVRFGPTVYANVGVKKEIGDIKFKQDDRAKKIRDIEEKEKEVEYENYKQEEPKEEKPKKECPEGERRHCEDCPCEPIEKAKHPRWLREGGIVENEKVTLLNKFFRQ